MRPRNPGAQLPNFLKPGTDADSWGTQTPTSTSDPCKQITVPIAPAGANLAANIRSAQHQRWLIVAPSRLLVFYAMVHNHGPWDYKQTTVLNDFGELVLPSPYEDFGNFNYGATGAAAGIQLPLLQRAAGWAQGRAGTSDPAWGHWFGSWPYGDDPSDEAQIIAGYQYYKGGCYK